MCAMGDQQIGWRNGAWRDGVLYSLLRTDPQARLNGPA